MALRLLTVVCALSLTPNVPSVLAQSGSSVPGSSLSFEVASVKPNPLDSAAGGFSRTANGLTIFNYSLWRLIVNAYGIEDFQLSGGPDWIDKDKFDVVAKAADGSTHSPLELSQMLQSLLAERFKLTVRRETRSAPVYWLVPAKTDGTLGKDLHRAKIDCRAPETPPAIRGDAAQCGLSYGYGSMGARGMPLDPLIALVSSSVRRPVVDKTGLTGGFDYSLHYNRAGTPDSPDPSMFGALEEQLGLKLQDQRAPVDFIVVEHVERPTPD
jgi:uncharacterized protein (TIGR03435 family)